MEDSIRDLDRAIKEVNQKNKERVLVKFPKGKSTRQIIDNQNSTQLTKSQCTWRQSPPMNTTFEVGFSPHPHLHPPS